MIVDRAEMQLIMGLDEPRFRELELAGLPCVHAVEASPTYDTVAVIRWYIAHNVRRSLGH